MTTLVEDLKGSSLTDFQMRVRTLGGDSWTQNSIEAHMRHEAARYQPNVWWHVQQIDHMIYTAFTGCMLMLFVFGGATGLFSLVPFLLAEQTPQFFAFATISNAGAILFCAVMFLAAEVCKTALYVIFLGDKVALGYAEWKHVKVVFDFKENVVRLAWPSCAPLSVVHGMPTAAKLFMKKTKEELTSATFSISYLVREQFVLDPVLWAHYNDEKVPVLVWDEHGAIIAPPQ